MSDRTPHGAGRDQSAPESDPSMEDILASIRRILSEDEANGAQGATRPNSVSAEPIKAAGSDDLPILDLNEFMVATDAGVNRAAQPAPTEMIISGETHHPPAHIALEPAARMPGEISSMSTPDSHESPVSQSDPAHEAPLVRPELVAPEAAAAAASSMGALLRTLNAERQSVAVRAGGPTIEDIIREEVRGMLKQWLDANLAPLVERLVRSEIERVVGRAAS